MESVATRNQYGSYRIEALVGTDSYGRLYKAYDESLDRIAALKILSHGLSAHTDFVHQFKKNIQTLAQLNHPRIPQIYYSGVEDDEYFVAFEWCGGGSLANLVRKQGRLALRQGIKILHECVQGLAAVWKLGIAHGNLKPNNLLISENREIKIGDFGMTPEKPEELEVQNVSGAISFMAPEIGDNRAIDFRADIYSLGVIFHYILLNRLPTPASSLNDSDDNASRDFLPADVYRIINRMTREDPQERHADYDELLQDIDQLVVSLSQEGLPTVPRAVGLSSSSSVKGTIPFDLFAELYRQSATGIMRIKWHTLQKEFTLYRGEIVFLESTQQNENLSRLAIEKKWLAESDSHQDPEELISRLMRSRACTLDQLREACLKLWKDVLLEVFQWPVFEGEFLPGKIENEPFVTLRMSEVLLEASRTLIDGAWVRSQIPPDVLIHKTESFEQLLAPFPMTAEESFLAYRFEGEDMKPDTLGLLTGLPEDRILRMTCLLQKIGALELRSATVARAPRPKTAQAPPSIPRTEPASMRPAVERARKESEKPVQPQPQPAAPSPPEPPRKLTYEEALIPVTTEKLQPQSPPKGTEAERKKKGENLFQKAELEYEKGNYGKAAHFCNEAIEQYADARYYHLLGASYSRHPRFQRDAEEALHRAVALAPSDPDFHAVLAAFYSQRDLWLRARTHCLRALDLSSGHKMASDIYSKILERDLGKGDCWCVRGESNPSG